MKEQFPITCKCDPKDLKLKKVEDIYILVGPDESNALAWPDGVGYFFQTKEMAHEFMKHNKLGVDVEV
jgi:hypothetical protein